MSKKGKIILGTIVFLLIAAFVVIMITMNLSGGAKITTSQFNSYVENAQYVNKDGTVKENVTAEELAKVGLHVLDGKVYNSDDKPVVAIWKVEVDAYQFPGYTYDSERDRLVRAYYCYGPTLHSAEGREYLEIWSAYGVDVDMSNPNSGNWMSTAFSVLSLVAV